MPQLEQKNAPQTAEPPKQASAAKRKPVKKTRKPMTEKEKNGASLFSAILILGVAAYLVIVLIIAMLVWYSFSNVSENRTSYQLRVLDDEENRLFTYTAAEANNAYGLYMKFSDLSAYCDLGVAGDSDKVTFFLPGKEDEVVCYRNSSLVQINGNTARISEPVLFEGKDYLLPVSLFENYLGGFLISYDEEKLLCTVVIPENPVFTPRMHEPEQLDPCTSLPFPDESSEETSA